MHVVVVEKINDLSFFFPFFLSKKNSPIEILLWPDATARIRGGRRNPCRYFVKLSL
jgi:hypothetical protein